MKQYINQLRTQGVTVVKYNNRKLYNVNTSKYVNITELSNTDVIVCYKTGKDISKETIALSTYYKIKKGV